MAQSFLIFDFGTNEEAAQQARHRIEAWKQAFRLDKKLLLKFERKEAEAAAGAEGASNPSGKIRLFVRLDFSDHEKLSHQRWLDRIPGEEPFQSAAHEIVRVADAAHAATAELFDSLD